MDIDRELVRNHREDVLRLWSIVTQENVYVNQVQQQDHRLFHRYQLMKPDLELNIDYVFEMDSERKIKADI
jgi:ADP-dependent phosphofructokinase/glucokinase